MLQMLAPPCIRNALLIPEKNNTRQVSATVGKDGYGNDVNYIIPITM